MCNGSDCQGLCECALEAITRCCEIVEEQGTYEGQVKRTIRAIINEFVPKTENSS